MSKQRVAGDLAEPVTEARALARKLGLEPYAVEYWIVDHDEMNELIAYEGFQHRYPHWRWGENYERQKAKDRYLGGKAFEIVNNDDPAAAFLQESNSLADQKAVITHVEAHADFFANNEWFADDPDAAGTLARHARRVERYAEDPDVERSEVERWIDNVRSVLDVIDIHNPDAAGDADDDSEDVDPFDALDLSDAVRDAVFDEEPEDPERAPSFPAEPERDLLRFLIEHGKAHDPDTERAVDYEPWQRGVLELLREEAHYFAPQRLTKVMNEGWAAYWESLMMGEEAFATEEEAITYADHQARVLNSPGLNPYKLGKEIWEYVENDANRRAVLERLLRVEGVTWRNFGDAVDAERVLSVLDADPEIDAVAEHLHELDPEDPRVDAEALEAALRGEIDAEKYPWKVLTTAGLAERHFSLRKPQHRGFLEGVSRSELEAVSRYLLGTDRYPDVESALADFDYGTGWERMRSVRESHNDVTFIDEFLTDEFVREHGYFAYEYSRAKGDYRATSTDAEAVKKKLLLQFTNFGKPRITVRDGNYNNRNELLLAHEYNGVVLDMPRARRTLERLFELWGRPVALKTVVKRVSETARDAARRRGVEPTPEEQGLLVRYDGDSFSEEELPPGAVADIAADGLDYDTRPEGWL